MGIHMGEHGVSLSVRQKIILYIQVSNSRLRKSMLNSPHPFVCLQRFGSNGDLLLWFTFILLPHFLRYTFSFTCHCRLKICEWRETRCLVPCMEYYLLTQAQLKRISTWSTWFQIWLWLVQHTQKWIWWCVQELFAPTLANYGKETHTTHTGRQLHNSKVPCLTSRWFQTCWI